MYCSNGSGMATLLQQKNCMKTLSNGSTTGGNTTSGNTGTNKILLPHEMVGLPVTPISTTAISGYSANNLHHQQSSLYYHVNSNNHFNNTNDINMYRSTSSTISTNSINPISSITTLSSPVVSYNNSIHSKETVTSLIQHYGQNNMIDDEIITEENQLESNQNINNEIVAEPNLQNMEDEETEPPPEIDIVINNVVCSFSVRCHLNLREIALNGFNVEFRRENGMVTMKLRRPYTTASIWSSGRITCTGATSEEQAKIAARKYARCLQKLGFSVRFNNFRVVNVLGTCSMPWSIKIVNFSERFKKDASYEPELHPGVTYKLKTPKATLKIFSTGSITVTAASVNDVQAAIEHIFPLVYEFRKERTLEQTLTLLNSKKRKRPIGKVENDPVEDIMYVSDQEELVEGTDEEVN